MILSFLWIPLLLWIFREDLLALIERDPELHTVYLWCIEQIKHKNAMGCFLLQYIGNLVIISFLPRHITFMYYYLNSELTPFVLITVSALAMFGAMLANYIFGFLFGFLFKIISKESFLRLKGLLDKYGTWIVLLGYFVPIGFPIGFLSVISGTSSFKLWKFLLVTVIGCVIYFTILFLLGNYLKGFINEANIFQ